LGGLVCATVCRVAWAQDPSSDGIAATLSTGSPVAPEANSWDAAQGTPFSPAPSGTSGALGEVQRLPDLGPPGNASEKAELGSGPGGGLGMGPGMGLPGMGGQGPVSYKTTWFPGVSVKGQAGDWGLVGQDFSFMCPVWIDSPNAVMLTGGVGHRLIDTDVRLPDSQQAYPDNLWNVRLGLMYVRQLDAGRMISCAVNVGSASDRPFASLDEMNVGLMAMYRRPSGERNAWMFGLMYSPTSEIQFPIPAVSFNWNPSDQFQANVGVPFMFRYRPTDRWTFEASYMPIRTIKAGCSYRLTEEMKIVGGYSWSNEVYMLADRADNSDRFFLYDQRVKLGLESGLGRWVTVELAGGYAFDRYSYSGEQWDSHEYDRVDMASGPFLTLGASMRR
jgi:hypothetical protein